MNTTDKQNLTPTGPEILIQKGDSVREEINRHEHSSKRWQSCRGVFSFHTRIVAKLRQLCMYKRN